MTPRPAAFDRIIDRLAQVRRRLWLRAGVDTTGWLLAALGGGLLLALLVLGALAGGPVLRWITLSLLAIGAATIVAIRLLRPARAATSDEAVAEHVERELGGLNDGLLACVQYAREWPEPGRGDPGMAADLAERMSKRLEAVDVTAVTSWRPLRRVWLAVLLVGAAWGLGGLAASETLARGLAVLAPADPDGRAQAVGPLVGDLTLTLHFPGYTGRAPRLIPNSTGDFEAPKGTRVEVRATTLAPAAEVALVFGEHRLPVTLTDGRDVAGEFVVDGATAWKVSLTTVDGRRLIESVERQVRVEVDQPPIVTLKLPAEDLQLDDVRSVPVVFEARDDFGLTKASIVVALAAESEHPERIPVPGAQGLRLDGRDEVDLSVVQAQPGDRLMLLVEAYDNNDVDGPQRGVSVTRYITVHSPQAEHLALTETLRQTVEVLLDALADRLEVQWTPGETPVPARIADLMLGSREAAASLGAVIEAMSGDPLTPDEVRLALAGALGKVEQALAEETRVVEPLTTELEAGSSAAIRAASRVNEGVIDTLEPAIILVEAMTARLALEDMAAMAERLKADQARLRELVQAFRNNPDDEALEARIMRDIRRLRDRMAEMQARMAQLRQKLPEEFLNLDGLKQDDVAKGLDATRSQLSDMEKMLEEGRIDDALAALDEMDKALDELSASLDQDMQDLHDETNPEMQRAISELMDQTRDLMKRQQEVGEKTQALADAEAEARRKAVEEEMAERMKGIEREAEALRRTVDDLARQALPAIGEEDLDHLRQRVDEMNRALEGRQLMEALEMAERAMDHLDSLDRFSRFEPDGERLPQLVQKGQQQDRDVMRKLAELIDEARQRTEKAVPSEETQALRRQQQGLSEAAERLRRRIEQQGQQMPGLGEETRQRAREAGNAMRESAEQLRRQRPAQARPGQQQAQSQLQSLMEGLRQAAQPQRADRSKGQQQRQRMADERVRIPEAEEYEAPAEFRQELLDAMKQRPSEQWQEQVKRYYESLIR